MAGFDYARPAARDLVEQWKRLALVRECIAPDGANRRNHRFDQALLTILAYRLQRRYGYSLTSDEIEGFLEHLRALPAVEAASM